MPSTKITSQLKKSRTTSLMLLLRPRQGSGVLWWVCLCVSVCVCVCLFVCDHIFGTTRPIFTRFLCLLPMAVARSSSGGVVIRYILLFFCFIDDDIISQGCTSSLGLGYKLCAVILVAGQRTHGITFWASKATFQVATKGSSLRSTTAPCFERVFSGRAASRPRDEAAADWDGGGY